MSEASRRMALARSLLAGRGLRVTDICHSVGATINVGAGRTTPLRYGKHKRRARRPGYYQSALFDLFLSSADWEVAGKTGYKLRWKDNARRIARESARLLGSRIRTIDAPRFGNRIRIVFHGGTALTVRPDNENEDLGWTLRWRGRHISLGDTR